MKYKINKIYPYIVTPASNFFGSSDFFSKQYNHTEAIYKQLKLQRTYFMFTKPDETKILEISQKLQTLKYDYPELFL